MRTCSPKGTNRAHLTGSQSKRKLACLSGDNYSSDDFEGEERFSTSQHSEDFIDDVFDCLSSKLPRKKE